MAKNKETLKKIWRFLWKSNSVWSWIVNVILAFVIIKFLLYPGIGLLLGTNLPIVAVISPSMEHPLGDEWMTAIAHCQKGPCTQEAWYLDKGISSKNFSEFPFRKGFNKGDIMILKGKKPENIQIGEIIVFSQGKGYPIIHRIVSKHYENQTGIYKFETKGDNNAGQIVIMDKNRYIDEKNVYGYSILGVAKVRIPYLGYIKIWFSKLTGI